MNKSKSVGGASSASSQSTRRTVLIGIGSSAVAGLGANALHPIAPQHTFVPIETAGARVTDGYRMSAHVLRYYETARS